MLAALDAPCVARAREGIDDRTGGIRGVNYVRGIRDVVKARVRSSLRHAARSTGRVRRGKGRDDRAAGSGRGANYTGAGRDDG